MTRLLIIGAAIPALALAAGCDMDLLVVQAQVDEACLSQLAVDFEGVVLPDGAEDIDIAVMDTFVQEDLGIELPDGFSAEAHVQTVALALQEGMTDFSFIKRARVEMRSADPDAALPPFVLVDIDNAGGEITEPVIAVDGDGLVNLIEYLQTDALAFSVEFVGRMPDQDWGVSLDMCFELSGEYRQGVPL